MSEARSVDLIIRGTVITVNAQRHVLSDGAVVVDNGEIVAVEPWADASQTYQSGTLLGGPDAVISPGLINTHQHLTGDRLMRSAIPDDLAPGESIFSWVVPGHAAHQPDDDLLSALLGLTEALGNGITTTVEAGTVAHPDQVAAAFAQTGARGTLGRWGWDVDGEPFAAPAEETLAMQRANIAQLADVPLLDGWVTLVGHDLMTDELIVGAANLARELKTGLTFHLSPSDSDAASYLDRTGKRPAVHLHDLGALGEHVLVAHAVHVDDSEINVLAQTNTAVAYCPWAYLRLGQGVVAHGRHMDMLKRGIRVGLGCDAENAGDAVDMLRTAAVTAGLAKDMALDPTSFGAHDALAMATIGSAAAIGRSHDLGSLEVGKRADVVVYDTSGVEWVPRSPDPVLQLVWASDGRCVNDVVVDGAVVVRDKTVLGVDMAALANQARDRAVSLFERSGVTPAPHWPVV